MLANKYISAEEQALCSSRLKPLLQKIAILCRRDFSPESSVPKQRCTVVSALTRSYIEVLKHCLRLIIIDMVL